MVALVGGMASGLDAMEHTMLQLNVNENQRGRAMGIWQLSIGFGPIGHLAIGAIADSLSPPIALVINGSILIVISIILALSVSRLRKA